jgi:hypothetical protein
MPKVGDRNSKGRLTQLTLAFDRAARRLKVLAARNTREKRQTSPAKFRYRDVVGSGFTSSRRCAAVTGSVSTKEVIRSIIDQDLDQWSLKAGASRMSARYQQVHGGLPRVTAVRVSQGVHLSPNPWPAFYTVPGWAAEAAGGYPYEAPSVRRLWSARVRRKGDSWIGRTVRWARPFPMFPACR